MPVPFAPNDVKVENILPAATLPMPACQPAAFEAAATPAPLKPNVDSDNAPRAKPTDPQPSIIPLNLHAFELHIFGRLQTWHLSHTFITEDVVYRTPMKDS